jgi:hypothetical protein
MNDPNVKIRAAKYASAMKGLVRKITGMDAHEYLLKSNAPISTEEKIDGYPVDVSTNDKEA